jgi:hypothetical protein
MKMYFKKHHGLVKLTITQNAYKYNLLRTVLIILFLQNLSITILKMSLTINSKINLNNGVDMPLYGLGK